MRQSEASERRTVTDVEETGAIDWLLLQARDKEINGELVPPLLDLVDRRLIRVLDVLVLIKRADDDFDALTTSELDTDRVGDLGPLAGASSGLLSDEDAAAAASVLEPNSMGLLIVYENLWSLPFARRRPQGRWTARRPRAASRSRRSWRRSTPSSPDEGSSAMGLIGGIARTAVVAGTATAVGNRVSRRQANRWGQQDQAAAYEAQYAQPQYAQPAYAPPQYTQPQYAPPQYAQPQYTPPAPPPPTAATSGDPMIEKIRQLAQLRDQGILTEEEFTAQKARILGS